MNKLSKSHIKLEDKITKDADKTANDRSIDLKDKYSTGMASKSKMQTKTKLTAFPPDDRTNPYLHQTLDQVSCKSISLKQPFRKVPFEIFSP